MAGLFKYKVLNFILFAVVLSVAFLNYETWSDSNGSGKGVPQKPEGRAEIPSKAITLNVKEEPESVQSLRIIAEKNIFNPERKDFPTPALLSAEQPKPVFRPQVILSGVVIFDDYQAASVSSPGRPLRKGEREAMTLKLGSKIGEYKLVKIADDRITLEAGGDSFEVLLYDPKKAKARVEVKTAEVKSSGLKSTQPVPAVDIAKAEVVEKPVKRTNEKAMTSQSPWAWKEARASTVRKWAAVRQSLIAGNQKNTGIIEGTTGTSDRSSGVGGKKPQ